MKQNRWIFLIFLLFGLAVSVSGFAISKLFFSRNLEHAALENAVNKTLERQSVLRDFFIQAEAGLVAISNSRAYQNYLTHGDTDALIDTLKSWMAMTPLIRDILVLDKDQNTAIHLAANATRGSPVVSVGDSEPDLSHCGARPSQARGQDAGKVWFSPPRLSRSVGAGDPLAEGVITSVFTPHKAGQSLATLVVCYNFAAVLQRTLKAPLYNMVLADNDGEIISHYKPELSWSRFQETEKLGDTLPDVDQLLGQETFASTHYFSRKLALPLDTPLYLILSLNDHYRAAQSKTFTERALIDLALVMLLTALLALLMLRVMSSFKLTLSNTEKQAEELDTKNQQIQQLLILATDGVHVLNERGDLEQCSDSFADLLKYSREQALRLNVRDWDASFPVENLVSTIQRLIDAGETTTFETIHRRADGTTIDVEIRARGLQYGGHRVLYASSRDISERKKHDVEMARAVADARSANHQKTQVLNDLASKRDQLAGALSRLELVLDSTGVAIWDWHIETGSFAINERWAKIIGYALPELAPVSILTWQDHTHPEDLAHSSAQLKRHWSGESATYSWEGRMKHKDGRWIYVQDTGRVVEWTKDGKPLRMLGTHLDVTARKEAEIALLERSRFLNGVMENLSEGVVVQDPNGGCTYMNRQAEQMLGWHWEELQGRDLHQTIHRRFDESGQLYLPETCPILEQVRRGESVRTEAECFLRKDGSSFPAAQAAVPLVDDNGISCVTVFQDISIRQQTEALLSEAARRSDEANQLKREFLANMSHEIRTPMNGVIGMTDLLLLSDLDASQRDQAQTIRRSAEALLGIINDILDFSKIEAGKLELERTNFDLAQMIEDIAQLLSNRANEKGIELICAANPAIHRWYRGDPVRIRQILTNLLGNAVKFTQQGEVALHYDCIANQDEYSVLSFSVRDTGIGLSAEQRERLFARFSQADGSTTRQFGGTGLGLAISKQLVEMMAGQISVDSELGKGSTFSFQLQLNPVDPPVAPPSLSGLTSQRILVVDDNETNRKVLGQFMQYWQVPHLLASSGLEALDACWRAQAEGAPFTMAIIDMQMPLMDGIELARQIRSNDGLRACRLVLLSSDGLSGNAQTAERFGFSACLSKPIRQSELYQALLMLTGLEQPGADTHRLASGRSQQFRGRALVVDDNVTNQRVAGGFLGKLGISSEAADNGQLAIEALRHGDFDLVFMDCQMPVLDGYAATEQIRAGVSGDRHQTIPIIALTANAMQGDKEKVLAAGMSDYLSKPLSLDKVSGMLQRWLPRSSPSGDASANGKITVIPVDLSDNNGWP